MGNSGSLHNLGHEDHYPPSWVQSMPRDSYHHRQVSNHFPHNQVKVLPELTNGPRLRTTNNGQILQQCGTISIKNQGLQRSRSVSAPHHYSQTQQMTTFQPQFLKARSQTQINFIPRESPTRDLGNSKKFGSESNIKEKSSKDDTPPKLPPKQKGLHIKKRKAPDVPAPVNKNPVNSNVEKRQLVPSVTPPIRNDGVNRKLRLFKTKAETKKTQNENNKQLPQETSDSKQKHFLPSFSKKSDTNNSDSHNLPLTRSNSNKNLNSEKNSPETSMDWKKNVPKIPNIPIFRREKSFDISLMSEMTRQRESIEQKSRSAVSPPMQRRHIGGKIEDRKLPKIPVAPKMVEKRQENKPPVIKSYVRKQIQPLPSPKNDFQQELLQATKRRSLAVAEAENKPNLEKTQKIDMFKMPMLNKIETKKDEFLTKEKSPSPDKIIINVKDIPPGLHQVDSPNLDRSNPKAFYFGMPGEERIENQTEEDVDMEQMELIDRFAESILIQQRCTISSESALSSDTEDNIEMKRNETEQLPEISLHLRPTLPRKQFDIPRFSPAAAWRLLASEEDKRDDTMEWLQNVAHVNNSMLEIRTHEEIERAEERIERIYREPIPGMQTDNKSGDSGISGDAGLAERAESPRNRTSKEPNNFSGAWTPQQDLGEETSTDEDAEEAIKHQLNNFQTKGHVFSLNLPRDTQTPTYSEHSDQNTFCNNQKSTTKLEESPLIDELEYETMPVIASDNWFLSRSPLDSQKIVATSYKNTISATNYSKEENIPQPVDSHETISYLTSGKHKMYLPNKDGCSLPLIPTSSYDDEMKVSKVLSQIVPRENEFSSTRDETKQELLVKLKSKKFTFQSTVRQVQRRKIAERLSKEAEEMEAHRLSELEIMRKVEEEFQRKRAREKASIRHQLQMYSQEEAQQCFTSLPVEWEPETRRSEPEGASPVPENSPTGLRTPGNYKTSSKTKSTLIKQDSNDACVDTKTPYISRIIEQKSGKHELGKKALVDIQPYHQRLFSERHHQSPMTHQNYISNSIPSGNQFIRGHGYRNSESSEISENDHHISSQSLNSRHFQSLMTSTYDKIFQ